jgi:hypothetical protein
MVTPFCFFVVDMYVHANTNILYQSFEIDVTQSRKKGIEMIDNSLDLVDVEPYCHGVLFLMIDAQMDLTVVPHDLACGILSA